MLACIRTYMHICRSDKQTHHPYPHATLCHVHLSIATKTIFKHVMIHAYYLSNLPIMVEYFHLVQYFNSVDLGHWGLSSYTNDSDVFVVNNCVLFVYICRHQPDPILESRPQQHDSSSTTLLSQDKNHLHQELTIKENTIRQKNTQTRKQDTKVKQLEAQLQQKGGELEQKDDQYAVLLHKYQQLQKECDQLRRERDQLQRERSHFLSAKPVSCSHLFVSFSSIKPYITTHYLFPSLNGLSYIVPPILPQSL